MKYSIQHAIPGRLRIQIARKKLTGTEADSLCWFFEKQPGVTRVKVYERTAGVVLCYDGSREALIERLDAFSFETLAVPDAVLAGTGREINAAYREKLILKILLRYGGRMLLPMPLRKGWLTLRAIHYIGKGLKCLIRGRVDVPVLDATAIGVSIGRGDFKTAGSIMFLLSIGELLEEWTHKKSVGDLARSLSLNVPNVWLKKDGREALVPSTDIVPGDTVVVRMGNVIPFDGEVTAGEGMVNQASLTGESLPVRRTVAQSVYAGTVLEEGELTLCVKEASGTTRFEKIVTMIEASEKLKSSLESRAEHLADRLVPYTFIGTGLVWLLTRRVSKALSVLMVDFSCALKLAMPITVLSAIREAGTAGITVKGGKYLEAIAGADTVVFDKTGTLTRAKPVVRQVVMFDPMPEDEALRIAACLEEHFPHSMAKAVVKAAQDRNLSHEEMHSKVAYLVAHGISSSIEGKKVVMIGDGINDSPALSAADAGIAISDGAELAREIADITITADNLMEIVTLKRLADRLMGRIQTNYNRIVRINATLIVLGILGVIQPTTSAFLHNASTVGICLKSMERLLPEPTAEEGSSLLTAAGAVG